MLRFAIGVTAVELGLTTAAALFLAGTIEDELFLDPGELAALGLPVENHSSAVVRRFDALFSYDTSAAGGDTRLWISVRPRPAPADYELRRLRANGGVRGAEPGSLYRDEDGGQERGYISRHRGRDQVRAEVVRYRPEALLIVAVRQAAAGEAPQEEAAARCERRARLVSERMAEKLGWR